MLCYKILVRSCILRHSTICLSSAIIDIGYIIVRVNTTSLACGLDLTGTLHTTVLSASRGQCYDQHYDKNIFHTANIGNADKISAEKLANDLYLHVI